MLFVNRPVLFRITALGAYGVGFLFYALALKRIELYVAYPVMVAVTVLELFAFNSWLGDLPSMRATSGAAFLIVGVWLLYSAQGKPV
ncbi:MAG TPA: hypothetical protein VEI25_19900 [Paraburkholderia sp.]|nr:hypothetical protein [Paraburkholderia sp.]